MTAFKRNSTTVSIYRALYKLLETFNFDAISVNEICQEALISRTTFYSYFDDKYQLVLYSFKEERKTLGLHESGSLESNLKSFLSHIKKNQIIYHNLLTSNINRELNQVVASQLSETIIGLLSLDPNNPTSEIKTNFYTGGLVFSMMSWVEKGCRESPELLTKIFINDFLLK